MAAMDGADLYRIRFVERGCCETIAKIEVALAEQDRNCRSLAPAGMPEVHDTKLILYVYFFHSDNILLSSKKMTFLAYTKWQP